ncbi:Cation channel sperm-associated protein subunit epsilon [Dissostichus eleginoides]|uniref:Cation channel sperm-associated protein subunit epsilon n=1 Tax=Dissostichus eleginoides TaxID=100907 RepID=A0AAD9C3P1_DISEL|nr:Cation channel sperm-associated protein subunit epsilon [Dissostichus eleginoides]
MEIPGMVTHWTEAISCAGINPCSPEGELECDRADYRLLPPQQTGPSNANSRGSHSAGYGGERYDGAPTSPPDL